MSLRFAGLLFCDLKGHGCAICRMAINEMMNVCIVVTRFADAIGV